MHPFTLPVRIPDPIRDTPFLSAIWRGWLVEEVLERLLLQGHLRLRLRLLLWLLLGPCRLNTAETTKKVVGGGRKQRKQGAETAETERADGAETPETGV